MGKCNVFYDLKVEIEGAALQWENHTCLLSAISQIWIGKPNERRWVLKDANQEGLNVELKSGSIHSFISDDKEFLDQAYQLLCSIVKDGKSEGLNTIDFEFNELHVYEEHREEILEPEPASVPVNPMMNPVKRELIALMEYCKQKEHSGTVVEQLLQDICDCYDGARKNNIGDLYKMFIQLTLVDECNELGLNALLEEVKRHVYGQ